jgi:hypothetical protein
MGLPRFARHRQLIRRAHARPAEIPRAVASRARRKLARPSPTPRAATQSRAKAPTWLYAPDTADGSLPGQIPGMTAVYSWDRVLENVLREQRGKSRLEVVVYPCAPLQVLEAS